MRGLRDTPTPPTSARPCLESTEWGKKQLCVVKLVSSYLVAILQQTLPSSILVAASVELSEIACGEMA